MTGQSLVNITDHPKIGVDAREYIRIKQGFDYYSGTFDKVKYINSYNQTKKRDFKPLNITKTAAGRLASVIFNEQCHIAVRDLDDGKEEPSPLINAANEFLEATLKDNNFYNLFETNLEKGIAAGGFAMRPYIDHDKIKISWIRADQFYPLRSNTNDITECAIATRTIQSEGDENKYYTLLEFHEWQEDKYVITNELYKSDDKNEVGRQVPLATLYPDIQEVSTFEGLKRPLFTYFRCPGANHKSLESPLGVGIVDKGKELLDEINETNDQLWWEIKMSARKVIVPAEYLKTDETHPPYFDTQQNVYVGVYGADQNNKKIQDMTPPLRSVQYKDVMGLLIKQFEVQIGLSVGTMSYADDGLKTATEVVSNNSMTYQTRSSYLTMVEKCINELVHSIFELAGYSDLFTDSAATFSIGFDDYKVDCTFEDGVFVDREKQLQNDLRALTANVMPKQEFLKRNYGLSDKEVQEWIDQLDEQEEIRQRSLERVQHQALFNQGG